MLQLKPSLLFIIDRQMQSENVAINQCVPTIYLTNRCRCHQEE